MIKRRSFLQLSTFGIGSLMNSNLFASAQKGYKPIVISTWKEGINANKAAWQILSSKGKALDAVEAGVMVTEASINCCVGLGANPDRDGIVTLDASIMDGNGNAGSVAAIERIKHPISVARRVMEKTPHVMLVSEGAQKFAVSEGFALEEQKLSPDAEKAYKEWLQTSNYRPVINIENSGHGPFAPSTFADGSWNHDTIGMVALDAFGNVSGSCTTSGMGFKMRGRVGDSPIIGAGLFADNEVGAATATGVGEEVIKICGTHLVVELMRQGLSPQQACKKAVERIVKKDPIKAKETQVGFIAINKAGQYGAFCLQKGFNYAVCYANDHNFLVDSQSWF
ncbi:MAG: N(4)-(beta-N-acetylglucosaminyl)-L-asparaginase [Segetibacter sp.]|nr:N(4)-(beta-N-acetylglucosaminyl)-L-asparaginase [Segetibacter sp.]